MNICAEMMLRGYCMEIRYPPEGRRERILFDDGSGVAEVETASTSNAKRDTLLTSMNSMFPFNRARPSKQ